MLLLTALILGLFGYLNYRIGNRATLYPPTVFCWVWAFDLFLAWCAGDYFYPMLPDTLFIFICGAVIFSLGSWTAGLLQNQLPTPKAVLHESSNRIITVLAVLATLSAPLYFRWLYSLVSAYGSTGSFLMLARMSTIESIGSPAATFFGTLVELATITAMIAFREREGHTLRAVVAIIVSLAMGVVTGQKVGPLTLVVAIIGIDWMKTRRVRWKLVVLLVLIMVVAIAAIEFYVHLGGASLQEQALPIVHAFVAYASGGMVGLDRVVREPNAVPQIDPVKIWYLRIAKRLGYQVEIPEVAQFVAIGPNGVVDNVYTTYWAYLNWGYLNAALFVGGIGLFASLIYKRALQGSVISILVYSIVLRNLVFSPFTEYFISNIYFLLKVVIVAWFVYSFPLQWAQFKRLIGTVVQGQLVRSR